MGAWGIAIAGMIVMGFLALHGPFNHINVVHAVGKPGTSLAPVGVKIVNDPKTIGRYTPETITVKAGQTITFDNVSNAVHSVTDRNNKFNISAIAVSGSAPLSIRKSGVYQYYCIYHPLMKGTIHVTA